jgi:predicted CXXCH cytochrome family protein
METKGNGMVRKIFPVLAAFLLFALAADAHGAGRKEKATHMNRDKVTAGCAACHRGRGAPGTALLKAAKEKLCFRCHGVGHRAGASTDIEFEFLKESRHPIYTTSHYHWFGEKLPEEEPSVPRHVACYDCHSVHVLETGRPWKGARGYEPSIARSTARFGGPPPGRRLNDAEEEYQLCYLCHSDSANLPEGSTNKAEEFDPTNESFHPVEMPGRNSRVPSLVRELSVTSTIGCGDCHGNNDAYGPKGPHGSDYEPILVAKYKTEDGIEGPKTYELCYMCHDRRSVLRDESFKRHNLHIVSKRTSCFTCHDSHGNVENEHLISFNEDVVGPSDVKGGPEYITRAAGMPTCYLKCHDADHNDSGVGGSPWPW